MAKVHVHWIGSDNLIEVTGVQNAITSTYINNAVVTCTVRDAVSESAIGSPLTLNYVSGSNGDYRAVLPDTLSLLENQQLRYDISVDGGADLRREWRLTGLAQYATK